MEKDKVYAYLCAYDNRGPYNVNVGLPESEHMKQPKNCKCDNCFYDRTAMANDYLALIEAVETFVFERDVSIGGVDMRPTPEEINKFKKLLHI